MENSKSISNLISLTYSIQVQSSITWSSLVQCNVFQCADERTGYHLLYFITLEHIVHSKTGDLSKWFLYDSFCQEFASDGEDSEFTEIQLMLNLGVMKSSDPDLLIFIGIKVKYTILI